MRKNGESVLLLDLEDERGASIRIICLGANKERYKCVLIQAAEWITEQSIALLLCVFTRV